MIQRYGFMGTPTESAHNEMMHNGEFVLHADHQAEVEKLEKKLAVAVEVIDVVLDKLNKIPEEQSPEEDLIYLKARSAKEKIERAG